MNSIDLLYSGLFYASAGMLFLWTGMLVVAAFVLLRPTRESAVSGANRGMTRDSETHWNGSKLVVRSS